MKIIGLGPPTNKDKSVNTYIMIYLFVYEIIYRVPYSRDLDACIPYRSISIPAIAFIPRSSSSHKSQQS
uniref:Uncharacterized protein n=1 Tax=Picea glauca TaxID=3330 RepID=A0A101LY75_PICGL|nr:hypothetical protein ABT39_MTgene5691 [Picea glauca]